jgi:hypothetical protein
MKVVHMPVEIKDLNLKGDLLEKEEALKKAIEAIEDQVIKGEIIEIRKAHNEIYNVGIGQFKTPEKKPEDSGKETKKNTENTEAFPGLTERQNKEKAALKKVLDDKNATEDQKRAITEALDKLHQSRSAILAQSIKEEAEKAQNTAYELLRPQLKELSAGDGEIQATGDGTKPKFLDLIQQHNSTLETKNGAINYELDKNTNKPILKSKNPEALGLAAVAAGWNPIEFSGDPKKALIAAKTAVMNGAQNIKFDQGIIEALGKDPKLQKDYQNLQSLIGTKKDVRDSKKVFTEGAQAPSDKDIYENLKGTDQQQYFVQGLSSDKLAKLAADTGKKEEIEQLAGMSKNPKFTKKIFRENYAQEAADNFIKNKMPKLKEDKNLQDNPEQAAKNIADIIAPLNKPVNESELNAYCKRIPEMEFSTKIEKDQFQKEIRTQLIANIIDRHGHELSGTNNILRHLTGPRKCREQVMQVLQHLPTHKKIPFLKSIKAAEVTRADGSAEKLIRNDKLCEQIIADLEKEQKQNPVNLVNPHGEAAPNEQPTPPGLGN